MKAQSLKTELAQGLADMMAGKDTNSKIGELTERVSRLGKTLETMKKAEASTTEIFSLDNNAKGHGGVKYDKASGTIRISTDGSTSNFVHEVSHVGDLYAGEIIIDMDYDSQPGIDLLDEVRAYKNQYAYDPYSITQISSNSTAFSSKDITQNWVQNINRGTLYGNLPNFQVNIFTTTADLQRAYPGKFQGWLSHMTMQNLPASRFIIR